MDRLLWHCRTKVAETDRLNLNHYVSSLLYPLSSKINVIKEDPDDDRILECAVSVQASVIVSGDSHLLDLKTFAGIDVITASEFIKQMTGQKTRNIGENT